MMSLSMFVVEDPVDFGKSRAFTQSLTIDSSVPLSKRAPCFQVAEGETRECKSEALVPMSLRPEVQKGIMVLFEKS
jgi:hypothetical protein